MFGRCKHNNKFTIQKCYQNTRSLLCAVNPAPSNYQNSDQTRSQTQYRKTGRSRKLERQQRDRDTSQQSQATLEANGARGSSSGQGRQPSRASRATNKSTGSRSSNVVVGKSDVGTRIDGRVDDGRVEIARGDRRSRSSVGDSGSAEAIAGRSRGVGDNAGSLGRNGQRVAIHTHPGDSLGRNRGSGLGSRLRGDGDRDSITLNQGLGSAQGVGAGDSLRLGGTDIASDRGDGEVGRSPVRVLGVTGAAFLGAGLDDGVRGHPLAGRARRGVDDNVRGVVDGHAAVAAMAAMQARGQLAVQEAGRDGAARGTTVKGSALDLGELGRSAHERRRDINSNAEGIAEIETVLVSMVSIRSTVGIRRWKGTNSIASGKFPGTGCVLEAEYRTKEKTTRAE